MFSWFVYLLHLLVIRLMIDPRPVDLFRLLCPVYIVPLITARQRRCKCGEMKWSGKPELVQELLQQRPPSFLLEV
jgi:hypothetical protein